MKAPNKTLLKRKTALGVLIPRTNNLAGKIEALRQKRGRYAAILDDLKASGDDQISLTDPDSRATPQMPWSTATSVMGSCLWAMRRGRCFSCASPLRTPAAHTLVGR
jgi:hypothetical protein